ncbi:MAG: hypothetical protein ACYTF6_13130, partial [Planctomycetota bacterium]|jgi:hypothetical protein
MVQWIADLDRLLEQAASLLEPNGVVFVGTTTPEFSKNGRWVRDGERFHWLITKSIARESELTMVNHMVGPVRFYPRSSADYLNAFVRCGLPASSVHHIYVGSCAKTDEEAAILRARPAFVRHRVIPPFTVFILRKAKAAG